MKCLYTRPGPTPFRRRECLDCGERVTTAEKIVNRPGGETLTGKVALAMSITQLLRDNGLSPSDLTPPVILSRGGPADDRPDPPAAR